MFTVVEIIRTPTADVVTCENTDRISKLFPNNFISHVTTAQDELQRSPISFHLDSLCGATLMPLAVCTMGVNEAEY